MTRYYIFAILFVVCQQNQAAYLSENCSDIVIPDNLYILTSHDNFTDTSLEENIKFNGSNFIIQCWDEIQYKCHSIDKEVIFFRILLVLLLLVILVYNVVFIYYKV